MTFGLTKDLSTEIGALIASEIGKITIGALQGGHIVLGGGSGVGGGTGVPPGGFVGQLIQTRVAFDITEESSLDIPSGLLPYSGASLLDNLNRIRYWIDERVTISGLASTLPSSGASMVGVEDAGGYYSSDNVEDALQELIASGLVVTSLGEYGDGTTLKGDVKLIEGSGITITRIDAYNGLEIAAFGGGNGVGDHNILDGDAHPDSVAQTVSRGSLIYGDSTPKWNELLIGLANRVLLSDGTDPAWAQITAAIVVNTPAGGIAATDVQAAINELDTEKAGIADAETISGDWLFSSALTLGVIDADALILGGSTAEGGDISIYGDALGTKSLFFDADRADLTITQIATNVQPRIFIVDETGDYYAQIRGGRNVGGNAYPKIEVYNADLGHGVVFDVGSGGITPKLLIYFGGGAKVALWAESSTGKLRLSKTTAPRSMIDLVAQANADAFVLGSYDEEGGDISVYRDTLGNKQFYLDADALQSATALTLYAGATIGGALYVVGNILTDGTVDGVDVATLKSTYDAHDHSSGDPTQVGHGDLTGVTSDLHHAQAHTLGSHSTKAHTELTGVTADLHHAQAHTLGSHSTKAHSELTGVTSDLHHAQAHKDAHKSGGGDAFASTDLLEAIVKRLQESGGPTTLLIGAVADGEYLKRVGAGVVGAAGATADHNFLDGSVHPDTVAQTVTRGSIIYGSPTPKWDELPIGTAGYALLSDGTDIAWGNTISADWLWSTDKKIQFRDPQIYIHSPSDGVLHLEADTSITFGAHLLPDADGALDIGEAVNAKVRDIYLSSGIFFGADVACGIYRLIGVRLYTDTDWIWSTDKKIYLRDTDIYIASLNDGFLDIVADTAIRLTSPVGIGAPDPKTDLQLGSAATQNLMLEAYGYISQNIWYTGAAWDSIDHGEVGAVLQISGGNLAFRHFTAADPPVGTYVFFVDGDVGKVGILTTTPSAIFQSGAMSPTSAAILVSSAIAGSMGARGGLYLEGSGQADVLLDDSGGNVDERIFQMVNAAGLTKLRGINDAGTAVTFDFLIMNMGNGNVYPGSNKAQDFGLPASAWDDGYADDWHNVADLYVLDRMDDLAVICGMKPSGEIDPRTGLPLIDDKSLPEWIFTKDKEGHEILYDPDGRPYISVKMLASLNFGAIRQLKEWVERLEAQIPV